MTMRAPPSFTDNEIDAILRAAADLDLEKRDVFLMRVTAARGLGDAGGINATITRALAGLRHRLGDRSIESFDSTAR
jgi:hypothetical protein